LSSPASGVHPACEQGHGFGLAMEHQCGCGRANAKNQRRQICSRLENRIAAKLLGLSPMKNLRFTIYDLRLALAHKRRAICIQSAIGNRQSAMLSTVPR
jgi:hypothetical protein